MTIKHLKPRIKAAHLLVLCAFMLFAASGAHARDAGSRLATRQLESASLGRTVSYNVLFPPGYAAKEHSGKRYPVLYLLHGLTGHYNNWAERTPLEEHSEKYELIIVMPEGNDGWYTNAENVPSDRYEDYVIKDLIPAIERDLRTRSDRKGRIIAGLSMGGYGALKFGFKYPERFALAGSFSGALNAARFDVSAFGGNWKALTDSITAVYGGMDSTTRRENDLFRMIEELPAEKVAAMPFIYLDCGTEDGLINANRNFAAKLLEKKVPHEFRQLPGAHNWAYWDKQIVEFLQVAAGFINKSEKTNVSRSQ